MNILLTSVGRRAYMVRYFKEALEGNGLVHVCNSDDNTVAFCYADKTIISPLIYSDDYIPFLLHYCKENKIDILISLFDIDLYILAQNKEKFQKVGTTVIVSEPSFIEICNDKWKTYQFLKNHQFHVPKTYLTLQNLLNALDQKQICYPIVVKPRFGCGSLSVSIAEDEMALLYYYRKSMREINQSYLKYESNAVEDKIIYQECLRGQEYGADVMNDLNGVYCHSNIRMKIAMRAGETDIAQLVSEPRIEEALNRLGALTGHIGNLDCDVFLVDDEPYFLEMNARFGGGYPFSHIGGCNLPKAIVKWACGETVDDEMLKARTGIKAYKELFITSQK